MIRGDYEGQALLRSLGVEDVDDIAEAVLTFKAGCLPTLVVTRVILVDDDLSFPTERFHLAPVDEPAAATP